MCGNYWQTANDKRNAGHRRSEIANFLTVITFILSGVLAHAEPVSFKGTTALANQHPKDGKEVVEFLLLDIKEDAPADPLQGLTFRANTQRTGVYQASGVPAYKGVKWKFKTEDKVISSPVLADGVVYVGSLDGNFYALNAKDGSEKWRFATKGRIFSSPTVYDGIVYFGSLDGHLYALDAKDGSLKWKVKGAEGKKNDWENEISQYQPEVACSPAVSYGIVFVSVQGRVRGFDAKTGKAAWNNPKARDTRFLSSPLIVDGKIAYSYGDCDFSAWTIRNGLQFYRSVECGNDTKNTTGAAANGVIYNLGQIAQIYANNIKTGEHLWLAFCGSTAGRTETGHINGKFSDFRLFVSSPAVTDRMLVVGLKNGVSGMDITKSPGVEKWFFKTGARVQSSPSIAGNIVYVGDDNGVLHALDIDSGAEKWQFKAGGRIISSAYVGDGVIYVGSDDGYLYAIE